jgi:hypothetical protein
LVASDNKLETLDNAGTALSYTKSVCKTTIWTPVPLLFCLPWHLWPSWISQITALTLAHRLRSLPVWKSWPPTTMSSLSTCLWRLPTSHNSIAIIAYF